MISIIRRQRQNISLAVHTCHCICTAEHYMLWFNYCTVLFCEGLGYQKHGSGQSDGNQWHIGEEQKNYCNLNWPCSLK